MNFVRTKRRLIHVFFMASLFVSVVSPVYAVTAELASSEPIHVLPVTKPLALSTPAPIQEASSEEMGPEKPAEKAPKAPSPTPTPSPTKTPITPTLTSTPTPTPTLMPTATTQPTQTVQAGSNTSTGGLNADVLFNMSNTYRAGKGLAPFQTEARICSLAAARAPEIAAEIAGGYMHAGKDSHNFPYRFTENIITMRTEAEAFNWWVNDYIHRVQIEQNNTHSCVACSGNACTQLFTSFQPK
jgi:uncharacterized protein YkwD